MKGKTKAQEFTPLFIHPTSQENHLKVIRLTSQSDGAHWGRYFTLLIIIVNIIFSLPLLQGNIPGTNFGNTLYHVHDYSGLVWIIPVAFFFFGLVQLIPRTYSYDGYDKMLRPMLFTFLLQVICFTIFPLQTVPGLITLGGTLLASIFLFIRQHRMLALSSIKNFIQIPFGLYVASLSVLFIMAMASWLKSIGWEGGTQGETFYTMAIIVATSLLGVYMAFAKKDCAFPAVMAWIDIQLWTEYCQSLSPISVIALSFGIFMIWCSLITLVGAFGSLKISLKPSYQISAIETK